MIHRYKSMVWKQEWKQEGNKYILQTCASDGVEAHIRKWSTTYWLLVDVAGFETVQGYTKLSSAIRGAYRALKRLYDVTHRGE